jgi:hypothetical protein
MKRFPIVSQSLTGEVLDAFHRQYLDASALSNWAIELLAAGYESESIISAAAISEKHWQDVTHLFTAICRDIGLSQDIESEVAAVRREVMIEEYRRGYRQGAELLHRNDDLRKEIGFPEQVVCLLLEDNDDGTNDSGYYDWDHRIHGKELEDSIHVYLRRAGFAQSIAEPPQ